tara:strand:+ start:564 stop:743 length:180 start_codon:yes stop_codon:yes gene_type:complete
MKIKYVIHSEGTINIDLKDEEVADVIESYKNNLQGFALAEVSLRTGVYNKNFMKITIED